MSQQQQHKEIAVFDPIAVTQESFQDSQIHRDLLQKAKSEIKRHVIEKEEDIEKIGIIKYKIYRPRSSVSVRKILKRKHFSAKA